MSNTVVKDLRDGVLSLTLNRPEKKNAFNTEQWKAFSAELDAARENDEVIVVVITGAGKDFSAGQDLSDSGAFAELPPYQICERAVIDFDKPLIGAAKGVAVGGGATMLFHCDILYVGESLRMRIPFTSLGMAPEFASTYMLQANIGVRRAAELILPLNGLLPTEPWKQELRPANSMMTNLCKTQWLRPPKLPSCRWGLCARLKGASNLRIRPVSRRLLRLSMRV